MRTDPILEELRAFRDAHAKQFDYDVRKMAANIRRHEQELKTRGWKLVRRPGHRLSPRELAA